MVKSIKGYALSCMTHCEEHPSQLEAHDQESSLKRSMHAAFVAVRDMLKRLLQGADASLFEALLKDEVSAKDCEAVIPADMLSLAHVLQLDWSQELEDLKTADADLVLLLTKVEKFQSAHGVLRFQGIDAILGAERAAQAKDSCGNFISAYLACLDKAVGSTSACMLPPLDRFIEKYKDVEKAVKEWDMNLIR